MIARRLSRPQQASAYSNGNPYSPARGRYAPRRPVEDYLEPAAAVIDLSRERVTAEEFVQRIVQEMKIPTFRPDDYIFPGDRRGRHLSPRTVQRVMKRTLRIAGIGKKATPHSLRHSFACHLFEDRTDIQTIQKLLGHAKIETTTIYTKVAVLRRGPVTSPLDMATGHAQSSGIPTDSRIAQLAFPQPEPSKQTVGHMKIELKPRAVTPDEPPSADVTLSIRSDGVPIELSGIVVRQPRPQWITLDVPLLETWREPLKWLTREQRERIESADFYELLQKQIGERFLRECQGLK